MKRSNKVPTNSQTKASQYNHERDHLLWLVYDTARLPFASPTIVTITDPYYWRAYHLYGKSGNSGRIQMDPFIPVEFLRKKVTPSKVLPFPRFYGATDSVPFVCLPVPGFLSRQSEKFTSILYMVQLFAGSKKRKKYHSNLMGNFYRNFRINSTRINRRIIQSSTLSPHEDHL